MQYFLRVAFGANLRRHGWAGQITGFRVYEKPLDGLALSIFFGKVIDFRTVKIHDASRTFLKNLEADSSVNQAKQMNKILFALALSSFASWTSLAVITPVSPFTGDYQETFESFTVQAVSPAGATALDQSPILGGLAKLQAANESGIYQNSGTTHDLIGSLAKVGTVNGGDRAFGSQNGNPGVVFFVEPIFKFGGYFGGYNGSNAVPRSTITVSFFDVNDVLMGQETINYSDLTGALIWGGWSSDVGIATISFNDQDPTFQFDQFAMDDLQVVVPEMENWIIGCLLGGVIAFKGLREYRSRRLAPVVVA